MWCVTTSGAQSSPLHACALNRQKKTHPCVTPRRQAFSASAARLGASSLDAKRRSVDAVSFAVKGLPDGSRELSSFGVVVAEPSEG